MRILQVHNRYRAPGGEDTVVANEADLLQAAGHQVRLYDAFNVVPKSPPAQIIMGAKLLSNREERSRLATAIREFQPDVVHFHNTFLTMGTSVFTVPRDLGVPSCLTAHNYRLFCIAGTAFRDGGICTDCCGRTPLSGARHACYKGDWAQSLALAFATNFHNVRKTAHALNAIACLNTAQRDLLKQHGFRDAQMIIKPNFVAASSSISPPAKRTHIMFLGHLSREKGLPDLQQAYDGKRHLPLDLVGDGPLRSEIDEWSAADSAVTVHGYAELSDLEKIWTRAKFLVFPSVWLEPMGMVVLEALSRGIPVIANPHRAVGIAAAAKSGISFEGREALGSALTQATNIADNAYQRMAADARSTHAAHFSTDAALPQLMNLYETAIKNHQRDQA